MRSLTNIKNLDLEILANLDDKDYVAVCSINSYFYNLCKGDELWTRKLSKTLTKRLMDFKLECITWSDYYFVVSQHLGTLRGLVVSFGDGHMIDELIIGWSKSKDEETIKYFKSEVGKKQAIKWIVSIIRRYPNRPLNREEIMVLRYGLFYDKLEMYQLSNDHEYGMKYTNEVDRAFILDKGNHTFSWMLEQGLKFDWKFINDVDLENHLYKTLETIIKFKIPIPSGIFFASADDNHTIHLSTATLELLLQHEYIPTQEEIDFSLNDYVISWNCVPESVAEVQKTYLNYGYFVSLDAFDGYVINWIFRPNTFDIINLYKQHNIYPDLTVPKEILKAADTKSRQGFQVSISTFTGLIELLELYQDSNIKINYQELANTAKKYNAQVIVEYLANKFNIQRTAARREGSEANGKIKSLYATY